MFIEVTLLLEKHIPPAIQGQPPKVIRQIKEGILNVNEVAVCCPLTDKETLVTLKCGRDVVISEPYDMLKAKLKERGLHVVR